MNELIEPGGRYSVALEVLASPDGVFYTRHRATAGTPVADGGGRTFLVVPGEICSFELTLGENGLTARKLKLLTGKRAHVVAVITPGSDPPDWLPGETTYLIFDGDRVQATSFQERFIPLEGMTAERTLPSPDLLPLDRLAIAVGRSVARANETLAQSQCAGGVALVSAVTIRVAVEQTDLAKGRIFVNLARSVAPAAGNGADCTTANAAALSVPNCPPPQYVEFTMTTVPCATPADPPQSAKPEESARVRFAGIEQDGGWFRCKG